MTLKRSLTSLNPEQLKAVKAINGKVLVLAGAGSGKTSVLINRCIHLIEDYNIHPSQILGLTFTNKAAHEMRERIEDKIGKEKSKEIVLSTFHSFCFYILKQEIHHLGYTKQFSIYDERDVNRLLKDLEKQISTEGNKKNIDEELENSMKAFNAVDFDGLLSLTVELFKSNNEVLKKFQDKFKYIMIDEYQDTNHTQFELADILGREHGNIFVVGDDDQSIYSWRGASVQNILQFDHSLLVKLEQNYRSTTAILNVANAVIKNNETRMGKKLWTNRHSDDLVTIFHAPNEQCEAEAVVQRIIELQNEKNLKWSDFAILYRSNNLSRPFEMALLKATWRDNGKFMRGIPYKVIQGMEFYERSEVKDFLAYLKTIVNPSDENALLRIINYPKRGISISTISKLTKDARRKDVSLWSLLQNSDEIQLTNQGQKGIGDLVNIIEEAQKKFEKDTIVNGMKWLADKLDLKRIIKEEVKCEKITMYKWDNIQSLISMGEKCEPTSTLHDFLTDAALDQNRSLNRENKGDRVNLLTFHSAKGLEFEACFLIAIEDKFLPHEKCLTESVDTKAAIEEERRLFYVAITRAKKYLTMSMAKKRLSYGKEAPTNPSRFLYEIPKSLFKVDAWDRI